MRVMPRGAVDKAVTSPRTTGDMTCLVILCRSLGRYPTKRNIKRDVQSRALNNQALRIDATNQRPRKDSQHS